jgi:hypothetical protein
MANIHGWNNHAIKPLVDLVWTMSIENAYAQNMIYHDHFSSAKSGLTSLYHNYLEYSFLASWVHGLAHLVC